MVQDSSCLSVRSTGEEEEGKELGRGAFAIGFLDSVRPAFVDGIELRNTG